MQFKRQLDCARAHCLKIVLPFAYFDAIVLENKTKTASDSNFYSQKHTCRWHPPFHHVSACALNWLSLSQAALAKSLRRVGSKLSDVSMAAPLRWESKLEICYRFNYSQEQCYCNPNSHELLFSYKTMSHQRRCDIKTAHEWAQQGRGCQTQHAHTMVHNIA